jgi:hypothetical protein
MHCESCSICCPAISAISVKSDPTDGHNKFTSIKFVYLIMRFLFLILSHHEIGFIADVGFMYQTFRSMRFLELFGNLADAFLVVLLNFFSLVNC